MIYPKLNFLTFKGLIFLSIAVSAFGLNTGNRECDLRQAMLFQTFSQIPSCPVVINEIMADPTPVVGLPDAEWIEIYNRSDAPVNLKEWRIVAGTSVRILPDSLLLPDQYAILCGSRTAPELKNFGKTVILATFPALRNSGNHLELVPPTGSPADLVDYSDTWYGATDKKNGGWSLERIDPFRDCGQPQNWKASTDPRGGTPAQLNSVNAENRDNIKPCIVSALTSSPRSAEITFNESMDTLRLKEKGNYLLSDGWGNPDQIAVPDDHTVVISWGRAFKANFTYSLGMEHLTDPCGNLLCDKPVEISWTILEAGDLVINEILFNPWPAGNDFVEIYNLSLKTVSSGKLILASRDGTGQLKNPCSLKSANCTIRQSEYVAFTSDTNGIFPFYPAACKASIGQVKSLPAFNNDGGTVVLLNDSLVVLDEFTYSEKMHHPMLADVEGVSLERVNPASPASLPENWHSASSETGFATPGYRNSQFLCEQSGQTAIACDQTSFSPNNDGFQDEAIIRYTTSSPGWILNCRIFDANGRLVFTMPGNLLAGTSGSVAWNGKDETGVRLPNGPYIVRMEFFNLKGNREVFRKVVILTSRGK